MANPPNGSAAMLAGIQEDRLQRAEDHLTTFAADLRAHIQTEDLRYEVLTTHIKDMGDRVLEKISSVASDVSVLKERSDGQEKIIDDLKETDDGRKKRNSFLLKGFWLIPAAALAEAGHRLFVWLTK